MTMFGRDSIFTSLQALPFAPELAATTLRVLGEWQGTRLDDFRDEDPGRILHEMRYGEMAAFEERPHSPYYGAVDATPLYVILLDEYERWTGDRALVKDLEYEARAAINWIDQYADLMGNGYISYKRRNERTGLENQSWKDSWNSISYADGRLPSFPRATCELQGYAYDAKIRGARLARLVWKDDGVRGPAREGGRRPQAPVQPRLLAGRSRLLRARARRRRQPGRLARLEQRAPAVERHRRRQQGEVRGRPPDGPAHVVGLGRPDAGRGRGSLQPGRLPPRHRVAVRQLVHRLGPAAVRVQGGGRADRVGDPRRRRGLRGPAAGGVRWLRPRRDEVPGQVPDRLQPAGVVDRGAAAAAAHDARPRAAGRPPRRRPGAAVVASATSSCSTSRAAGAASTPSGAAGSTSTRIGARPEVRAAGRPGRPRTTTRRTAGHREEDMADDGRTAADAGRDRRRRLRGRRLRARAREARRHPRHPDRQERLPPVPAAAVPGRDLDAGARATSPTRCARSPPSTTTSRRTAGRSPRSTRRAKSVTTVSGDTYAGDYLVLAAGSQPNFFKTPGAEHAFPLYSLDDARAPADADHPGLRGGGPRPGPCRRAGPSTSSSSAAARPASRWPAPCPR